MNIILAGHGSAITTLRKVRKGFREVETVPGQCFEHELYANGDLMCLLEDRPHRLPEASFVLLGLTLRYSYDKEHPAYFAERKLVEKSTECGKPIGVIFDRKDRVPPRYIDMSKISLAVQISDMPPALPCRRAQRMLSYPTFGAGAAREVASTVLSILGQ